MSVLLKELFWATHLIQKSFPPQMAGAMMAASPRSVPRGLCCLDHLSILAFWEPDAEMRFVVRHNLTEQGSVQGVIHVQSFPRQVGQELSN